MAGGRARDRRSLILHGGPGMSDYTSSLADELVEEFTVYRYQQRGLAPSTTDGPFTVETHAPTRWR